jgi:SAM-dependent methyltransferase
VIGAGLERARHAARRRLDAARHRGTAVECPLCGGRYSAFKPAWNRANAICWRCGAHERHRAIWVHLQRHPELLAEAGSLLHFAPEYCLERRLRAVPGLRYVTADLDPALGELELDVTALALADGAFDAILCSHVLEHVPDDAAAMRELHRVVAPGGWVLVMVPIDHGRDRTYEDPAVVTPQERVEAYWQADHVRLYARDIAGRLERAGFEVARATPAAEAGPRAAARHGLLVEEDVFLCRRAPGAAR